MSPDSAIPVNDEALVALLPSENSRDRYQTIVKSIQASPTPVKPKNNIFN